MGLGVGFRAVEPLPVPHSEHSDARRLVVNGVPLGRRAPTARSFRLIMVGPDPFRRNPRSEERALEPVGDGGRGASALKPIVFFYWD